MRLSGTAAARPAEDAIPRWVLPTLCLTQVVGWGTVYYSFPVLSGVIGAETGWSATGMAGAFTGALLTSAALGVPVGRWLDRHGPRVLMTVGSLLAAAALGMIAWSPSLGWFASAWVLTGIAMSATLYPPAFAALTRWYGPRRIRALTVLTLAGGLASTVFAPVTALLADRLGWRAAYAVLAALVAVVAVPAHGWGLRGDWPAPPPPAHLGHHPGRVVRSRAFLLLAAAFSLGACASYAVVVNLVPLLTERGMGLATAAVVLGAGGAAQVVGRLGYPALARWVPVRARTAVVLAGVAVTTAVLALLTSTAALVCTVAVAGALRGILTLLHATAVTDRWGMSHYGSLTGLLSAPVTISAALAPWLGAAMASGLGGYPPMFLAVAALAAAAALAALGSLPPPLVPPGGSGRRPPRGCRARRGLGEHRRGQRHVGNQLGDQVPNPGVEVGHDAPYGRGVLASGVVDRPVAVGDPGDVRALLAAAQGDRQVARRYGVPGQQLRVLPGGVQAQDLQRVGDLGVDVLAWLGARRERGDAVAGIVLGE